MSSLLTLGSKGSPNTAQYKKTKLTHSQHARSNLTCRSTESATHLHYGTCGIWQAELCSNPDVQSLQSVDLHMGLACMLWKYWSSCVAVRFPLPFKLNAGIFSYSHAVLFVCIRHACRQMEFRYKCLPVCQRWRRSLIWSQTVTSLPPLDLMVGERIAGATVGQVHLQNLQTWCYVLTSRLGSHDSSCQDAHMSYIYCS